MCLLAHEEIEGCNSQTCSVEVRCASDTDLLLTQLYIEEHGLVRLRPGEVDAMLNALICGDPILESPLVEAVARELRQGWVHPILHLHDQTGVKEHLQQKAIYS